jgi:putative ABC transport system ATP-binding protein
MDDSVLILENVNYRYKNGDGDVIRNLSATFGAGKLHAVVGPSGCGKTTLLSIMAGLDVPQSGTVRIDGEDLSRMDLDMHRRDRVSMVFQAFHLFPLLTALENVCYPMSMNGIVRFKALERAKRLLKSVDIDEGLYRRFPSNLSGGEQQRVAIARALAAGTKVILADEPTGNLDVANGRTVMGILRRLARDENRCIVTVTHNSAVAEASDVVFRMSEGSFVQCHDLRA